MMHSMSVADAFRESGRYDLMGEFIETLVNDPDVPRKLARQVWVLVSTAWDGQEVACAAIVASFQDSEDEGDLVDRWSSVVSAAWPDLPDMPLRREIDKL